SAAGSASPTGSKSPKASPSKKKKKAETGKDGKDGKDGQPGKDGRNTGSSGGGSGSTGSGSSSTGGGGSSSTTTSGGGSGGSGTGGSSTSTSGGGGSTSTSGGSSTGGSGGGGSTVPASFVGTWKFGEVYNANQPGTVEISKSGVVTMSDFVYASCPYEAKVTSSSTGRINISASKLVGPNPGYCYWESAASFFVINADGIQHDVNGFKYFYKRA
ncbi:serine/threonine protein kinase, partial [Streptomyces sp. SID2563]|nr:serine/threonine protein kinase [Streptomyces sp. SID2563]